MTSPCSRIFSTTARDLRIRSRDSSVNSKRSFPVATAFNCASEIERPEISTARSYLLDRKMTKHGEFIWLGKNHTVRNLPSFRIAPQTMRNLSIVRLRSDQV